ncbi:hypothetical protein [Paraburkholderia sp. J8-2]|uniref:hypothetical protein n=1 Tax=Paraburkholderia sp. J8-2 TaxID=2805440 RepID=UPI002AB771CE|nr:hypothetical protein [Paraburkholderia sp. J8-2]
MMTSFDVMPGGQLKSKGRCDALWQQAMPERMLNGRRGEIRNLGARIGAQGEDNQEIVPI